MDNVISFSSRRPLAETIEQKEKQAAFEIEEQEEGLRNHLDECLLLLDQAMTLVTNGKLQGLILIGIDAGTGRFLNEIRLRSPAISRDDLFRYVGVMESIQLELVENAAMAPMMGPDGKTIDPFEDDGDDEFDEDDG